MPFTPFNCHSFLLSLTSPRHHALPLWAELNLLCVQTFRRPYRDLSSLCLYAHEEIHFSPFITAQARIAIICPFSYEGMVEAEMLTECWHTETPEFILRNTPCFLSHYKNSESFSRICQDLELDSHCQTEFVLHRWNRLGTCFCELPM